MVTFQKREKSWRVFVYRQGIRKSESSSTKAEDQAWMKEVAYLSKACAFFLASSAQIGWIMPYRR
jgi:hypothetical protein